MLGTSKDIKYPGLNILPPGVERHVVNGGALTAFQIFPDDEIEIINNEGNQTCEIICFDKHGNSDVGILNLKSNNEKNFIRNILDGNDETILALLTNIVKSVGGFCFVTSISLPGAENIA